MAASIKKLTSRTVWSFIELCPAICEETRGGFQIGDTMTLRMGLASLPSIFEGFEHFS